MENSPFQEFIRYLKNKNTLRIRRHVSSTTKDFRMIECTALSQHTIEVMVKSDFDGHENAKL